MTNARWLTGVALLGFLAACGDDGSTNDGSGGENPFAECTNVAYPSAPEGLSEVVYVSACGSVSGDGSRERPFSRIQEAIDRVLEGGAVLVAAGEYAENLEIHKPVAVLGIEASTPAEQAGIILQAPAPNAILVNGAIGVVLRGFHVKSPVGAGLRVDAGAEATLEGSWIEGAMADAGKEGHGVVATNDASIILQRGDISGAAGVGVLIDGAKGRITDTTVRESKGAAGIRIERATGEVRVEASHVRENASAGIAVLSSRAIILQSEVMNTIGDGTGSSADGIFVAELEEDGASLGPAEATIEANTIEGNDRTGILFSGNTKGIILQNHIRQNADHATLGAGVWLQAGAGNEQPIELKENTISGNRFLGVGVSGSKAIILQSNAISDTALGDWTDSSVTVPIGEGVGVLKGGFVRIEGNTISSSAQRGILLDEPDASSVIKGNTFAANGDKAIILQSTTNVEFTDNDFSQNPAGGFQYVSIFNKSLDVPKEDLSLSN
ncbi:right-handed parallel beta-helix repeat-containing protein [Polyangium aurulentum]|uniref:right-handed parallel beta-helix repeat-containing protein n=1 Tax=Polyangium aurulentum TaxID=2567896 RepID=UPI0010AE5AC8|nr:right-handed parallel beta-helix repeat-containing protein [Polyangium aurulentum]UQA55233.1 right-handed parallel beta-helix repeat-containing protein [Polyangium aurulentum]